MINRGGFSFVAMLVINPIVILFYQNCSMVPVSQARVSPPTPVVRRVASEPKNRTAEVKQTACAEDKQECPRSE